jgi:acyl dehydratase
MLVLATNDARVGRNESQDCIAMTERPDYYQLSVGFEYPDKSCVLDEKTVSLYVKATEDPNPLFKDGQLVPPMAVAANVMAALGESVSVPAGGIHVSQELQFLNEVKVGDTITCKARISRKVDRGGLHMVNIDIEVFNQTQIRVLAGKVGLVLP